jgi:hypothetical protein
MSTKAKREYLIAIRERYKKSTKKEKGFILNEYILVCEYNRKYAIKILNGKIEPRTRKPGPKSRYSPLIDLQLIKLWQDMGEICSKQMKVAIPIWLPFMVGLDKEIEKLLIAVSPATIDRILKPHRRKKVKGLSGTRSFIKSRIPIELLHKDVEKPGYVEGDTVAHCGDALIGEFVNSLTVTDLFTGWTDNRATLGKTAEVIVGAIKSIEKQSPFLFLGYASDNGTEFLNDDLYFYFNQRKNPVKFVRRRPYKKNDNAHVEQKNNTHVREIFGYERFESIELVNLMNDIYQNYWNPFRNYFIPSMKLKSKERIGSKVKKKYDVPKTPYQRIMDHPEINPWAKGNLQLRCQKLNPFTLKKELDRKLNFFFRIVEIEKKKRLTGS